MNILIKQYRASFFQTNENAVNIYKITYLLFGLKVWSKTLARPYVPVHAWAGVACCGSTSWSDEFHNKYKRISNACRNRKTVPLISF